MSEPTTDEMIAWCEGIADERAHWATMHTEASAQDEARDMLADAAMLRAIAARLRQASGKAEPAPTYDAQPPGLTVLAPKRPVE